jgi:dCMP deaminase
MDTNSSILKWDLRFLGIAREVSHWSRDPSTKVGAVAVRDKRVLALGYNGLPSGVQDLSERLENREIKYLMTSHAETNLLTYAAKDGVSLNQCTCYVTLHPCSHCAAQLINSGVRRIVVPVQEIPDRWKTSFNIAQTMFQEAGVLFDTVEIAD